MTNPGFSAQVDHFRMAAPSHRRGRLLSPGALVLTLMLACTSSLGVLANGPTQSYDCSMRATALEYAMAIQPFRTAQDFQDVADALNGSPQFGTYNCGVSPSTVQFPAYRLPYSSPLPPGKPMPWKDPSAPLPPSDASTATFYIDPVGGSDSNPGTQASPFLTIQKGVDASRATGSTGNTLVLRAGTFYLPAPVLLGTTDSGLTFTSYPGEDVWISGGIPLPSLTWTPFRVNSSTGANIWQASLAGSGITSIPGLRYGGRRFIRARYPNADPEVDGFGSGVIPPWIAPDPFVAPPTWNPPQPSRNDTDNVVAQTYSIGYVTDPTTAGGCAYYDPPAGYFCGSHTTFGGTNGYPQWPKGINVSTSLLPNSPYSTAVAGSAVVHGFRGNHWFTRMHQVGFYQPGNETLLFDYGKGGFQGAEGTTSDDVFYIENVFEELDAPAEWFFNASTETLFIFWNETGAAPPADGFVATSQKVFFNITAPQSSPAVGISFKGVNFRDQAITYFEPHGLPSGGDYSIQPTGALFVSGVENFTVVGCDFDRMDGIAIFQRGYTRFVNISYNTFAWSGATIIAMWGFGDGGPVPGMGPDLTGGAQPRYTTVSYNIARELGIWQKQSPFVFQAVAGLSEIFGNIFYNGPRSGINFNDGSLGGSNVTGNLAFNFCRETGE
jgi:hypothetical protein